LQTHFHIELAAFADGGNVDVFIENLDIAICLDHAGGYYAGLLGAQVDRLRSISRKLERNLLEVKDDVGCVFDNPRNGLKLVEHAFDLDGSYGCAFDR